MSDLKVGRMPEQFLFNLDFNLAHIAISYSFRANAEVWVIRLLKMLETVTRIR